MSTAAKCGQVTPTELSRLFGVTRPYIYELVGKGLPREGRHFDVAECVQWYLGELKGTGEQEPEDLTEARRRLYVAQTEKTRLENDRLRGSSIDIEEALALFYSLASIVATQHDAVGPRIAGLVIGETDVKAVQTLLFDEHRAIRESIADAIMGLPRPGGSDSPPPAQKNRRPVGRRKQNTPA